MENLRFGKVISVSKSNSHSFNKYPEDHIVLLKGLGVEGDAHMGPTVKHRSRVAKDPTQPNLRQVHLIHSELFDELRLKGFKVSPGEMGENITTKGIELLKLYKGSILKIGEVRIEITGLRNPCIQLESIKIGLMQAVLDKDVKGNLIRKAGVMGVVLEGGVISVNDNIEIVKPNEKPFIKLEKV